MSFDLNKKRSKKSFIYSKFFLLIILVITFFFLKATYNFYTKAKESTQRKETAEKELIYMQERKKKLEEKINSLNSPIGVEEELRNRFDLIKEGENVILIKDETN